MIFLLIFLSSFSFAESKDVQQTLREFISAVKTSTHHKFISPWFDMKRCDDWNDYNNDSYFDIPAYEKYLPVEKLRVLKKHGNFSIDVEYVGFLKIKYIFNNDSQLIHEKHSDCNLTSIGMNIANHIMSNYQHAIHTKNTSKLRQMMKSPVDFRIYRKCRDNFIDGDVLLNFISSLKVLSIPMKNATVISGKADTNFLLQIGNKTLEYVAFYSKQTSDYQLHFEYPLECEDRDNYLSENIDENRLVDDIIELALEKYRKAYRSKHPRDFRKIFTENSEIKNDCSASNTSKNVEHILFYSRFESEDYVRILDIDANFFSNYIDFVALLNANSSLARIRLKVNDGYKIESMKLFECETRLEESRMKDVEKIKEYLNNVSFAENILRKLEEFDDEDKEIVSAKWMNDRCFVLEYKNSKGELWRIEHYTGLRQNPKYVKYRVKH